MFEETHKDCWVDSLLLTEHLKLNHMTKNVVFLMLCGIILLYMVIALVFTSVFQTLYSHCSDWCRVEGDVTGVGKSSMSFSFKGVDAFTEVWGYLCSAVRPHTPSGAGVTAVSEYEVIKFSSLYVK